MHIPRLNVVNPFVFARRAAGLAVFAGVATLGLHAEQPVVAASQPAAPFSSYLNASSPVAFNLSPISSSSDSDIAYSSSTGSAETSAAESFMATTDATQPPPRRRYGRPRYSDGSHNADGSNKWTGEAGVGLTIPVGNTHAYYTPSYAFQVGFGRNFNKNVALLAQFDWDNLGLQGKTINNESELYFGVTGVGLDGHAHDWSFTLNPMYTLSTTGSVGAYVVGGVGFYHKVTDFTVPGSACADYLCEFQYTVNETYDHYTSNAIGVNGGLGFTYKPSRFANERFFVEARYVYTANSQRQGITVANESTPPYGTPALPGSTYTGYNYFPASSHRTTYIPIKFGLRF
ncbi:hypothetical protein SAMN05421770_10528 [Granulicella rosea]|uniref:Outer membrane protein beta-barrel domain-containing protein n=1 Tax=Granulicella rosea TaxID=474952 RepID=A0A239KK03_9BACT|nr:hypothetical protein [Granulicella rosea]SNT18707.1 hypothetical protein SAMN05421770_10528 [Granulicella rosea]